MELVFEKRTGTYADTLEAIGAASLFRELGFTGVVIADHGTHFSVKVGSELPSELWPDSVSPGYPYIWESSKEPRPPLERILDYESEKRKRDAIRKAGKKTKAMLEAVDVEAATEPVTGINTATILASMRKGWNGDRDLAKWIQAYPKQTITWIRSILGSDGKPPEFLPIVSNSQILNPISGKGVHAAKTEMRSAGSLPAELVNPFSEWMKLRGLWNAMLLYRSVDDFKFFVIEPCDIPFGHISAIRSELEKLNLWGGVRLDIKATLRCAEILIQRSDVMQDVRGAIPLRRRRPRQVISGLRQAYFKSLGTAAALMNDALLPLPGWFAVESQADGEIYLNLIEEAIGKGGCLNSLQEKNADDGRILQQYREWLLTGELRDLLEFHQQFVTHLIQRYTKKEWARPFATENLSKILKKAYEERHHVVEIIEDNGFQSIARAMRNSTIYALTVPNMRREVRFGLAQKWKQKMKAGDENFASEMATFVQDYNWETVHRLDGKGHLVTTEELDSLVRLIQTRHAELVGSLLLAYGFSRAPKVESGQPEEVTAQA